MFQNFLAELDVAAQSNQKRHARCVGAAVLGRAAQVLRNLNERASLFDGAGAADTCPHASAVLFADSKDRSEVGNKNARSWLAESD